MALLNENRHLIETARTLLISSFIPSHFLGEAVSTAIYLINRQLSSKLSDQCRGGSTLWYSS
jgi:hypothetical protein